MNMFRVVMLLLVVGRCLSGGGVGAQEAVKKSAWGDFVERDFPFFSTVLDCRELGEGLARDNLTPRGLVLNLGSNVWVCYDLDLLRIACVWEGEEGKPPVTPEALAPGSYHVAGQKTKDGQEYLPKPVGKVWLTNGIYPGWQVGEKPSFVDPREPGPSVEEVGRGAMDLAHGRVGAVTMAGAEVVLEYAVGDCMVQERVHGGDHKGVRYVERICTIPGHEETLMMVVAARSEVRMIPPGAFWVKGGGDGAMELIPVEEVAGHWVVRIKGSKTGGRLHVRQSLAGVDSSFSINGPIDPIEKVGGSKTFAKARFDGIESTKGIFSSSKEAYVVDKIPLPVPNRWKRNVRLADIDFLDGLGNAVGVTFDGDVWLISGLKGELEEVTWRRFASGLHEPMSVVVKDGAPFVYDRNGIWKLADSNGDGECDRYEMFCNLFAQTAETREFPNSMKLGPDGSLFISKGGQEGTTRGKHNGTVIKVAADGKSFEVVGHGLRQPFIGVNPVTGLVTASDQQGNWVPSTPIQVIRDNPFYGHLPTVAKGEAYPKEVAEPLVWLPHPVNPSGATQVWALDERFGPVAGEMIHVGYNRPELFRVVMKGSDGLRPSSAAVMSFTRELEFGPLNGKVNPADGQLYVVGFQVWGTTAKALSGLARLRYTGAPRVLMKELTATDKGVILKFNAKLDKTVAEDPANYSAERWNYRRTEKYGSPHLKLDGSSGQEWMTASSAYLSEDGKSVMVGFPEMKAGVQQMRIGWGIKGADGLPAQNTAYFTPSELEAFDARAMGFGGVEVDLTPRAMVAQAMGDASVQEGEKLYQMFGCMACHSTDGNLEGKVGPSWKGLFGSEREIANTKGKKVKADADYLKESILNPGAKVVRGFEKFDAGMPIYEGILNAVQVESLILYIKTLE
jgi:cytochrome c2